MRLLSQLQQTASAVCGFSDVRPVSYTHLDVYKRQVLLLLLFYSYGVIATDLFGKSEPSFATIPESMKQLFFVAFEGWSWIYDLQGIQTLLANGFPDWIMVMFFGSFLFISAMIFLNLFIGIITSEMENTRASEKRGKSKIFKKGHTLIMGWSRCV